MKIKKVPSGREKYINPAAKFMTMNVKTMIESAGIVRLLRIGNTYIRAFVYMDKNGEWSASYREKEGKFNSVMEAASKVEVWMREDLKGVVELINQEERKGWLYSEKVDVVIKEWEDGEKTMIKYQDGGYVYMVIGKLTAFSDTIEGAAAGIGRYMLEKNLWKKVDVIEEKEIKEWADKINTEREENI